VLSTPQPPYRHVSLTCRAIEILDDHDGKGIDGLAQRYEARDYRDRSVAFTAVIAAINSWFAYGLDSYL
jgi:hypothetical protein